jgi:predicted ATPase
VQAGLADVFIDAIKHRQVQIIIESHSEHLLRRLQRRMAEEKIEPSNTALYFTEMQGAQSVLTPLRLDHFGNIQNWPANFFGDEIGDLAAMGEAMLKRRVNGQ